MNKAVSAVNPGDIVTVRGGLYREQVNFRRSGTAEKPIIFRGAPGETVLHTAAYPVTQPWKKSPGYRFIYDEIGMDRRRIIDYIERYVKLIITLFFYSRSVPYHRIVIRRRHLQDTHAIIA